LLVDIKHKNQKWHRIRSKLYGLYATYIALAIVLVFAVVRNL
jgi:hypothetical protein